MRHPLVRLRCFSTVVTTMAKSCGFIRETHQEFLAKVKGHGTGTISLEKRHRLAVITLNNPSKRNAISGTMMNDLADIVDNMPSYRDGITALILTGAGTEAFCAGADFSLVKNVVNTPDMGVSMSRFMIDCLETIRQSGLISLCYINGHALGGGAELTTVCDFRVMNTANSVFVQFVHPLIGASPGWGGARRLYHIVGRQKAISLCCGSMRLHMHQGLEWGFLDESLPSLQDCETFLQPFTSKDALGSVYGIKRAIAANEYLDSDAAKRIELEVFRQRWFSEDNITALASKK